MVHGQWKGSELDIWRMPGRRAARAERVPEKLISSSARDANPAYSPDGRKIVFASDRSGVGNIWICDSDGANPVQVTSFERPSGTPRWSPDSRTIVFDSLDGGSFDLYVLDTDGGLPRQLTHEPSVENRGTFSRDGRWVYFTSDRDGSFQIWKMPVEGGPAVRVTQGGGVYAVESADGEHLYYANRDEESGIWRVPVSGGEETEVVPAPVSWGAWALFPSGIYYATYGDVTGRTQDYAIQFLDFELGQVTELYRKEGPFGHAYLDVSPDEEWILYGETPFWTSELMLVENFR
jgi:WD40 repeat protein